MRGNTVIVGWVLWVGICIVTMGKALPSFIDVPSALIVLGGAFARLLLNFNLADFGIIPRTFLSGPIPPR